MKKGLKLMTGIIASMVIISSNVLPAYAASSSSGENVKIVENINDLKKQLNSMETLKEGMSDADKKADIEENIGNLATYLDKVDGSSSSGSSLQTSSNEISTSAYLSVGDSATHSHYSTSLTNNYAIVDVNYDDSYGFPRSDDFSCTSKSRWYGNSPLKAYKITNKGSATVYGVAVSMSFGNASVSGAASASDSVSDSNSNDWMCDNNFDVTWGSTVVSGSFTSTSTVKVYSSSTSDSTNSKITVYI